MLATSSLASGPVSPKIALVLAVMGLLGLPLSAFLGVGTAADYVLDVAEVFLALAAAIMICYVALGIVLDARA